MCLQLDKTLIREHNDAPLQAHLILKEIVCQFDRLRREIRVRYLEAAMASVEGHPLLNTLTDAEVLDGRGEVHRPTC